MGTMGIFVGTAAPARSLAALSCGALDRPLSGDAELTVGVCGDETRVLGAFQRLAELGEASAGGAASVRRASGGAAVRVAPGTVWLTLALARPSAIVPCDASRLVNRYVRPVLRGLTRVGALAHYFGRDWVSVAKRPVALVSFAYDAVTGRALFEALIGTTAPFDDGRRASFMGSVPESLAVLAPSATPERVQHEIVSAYRALAAEAGLAAFELPASWATETVATSPDPAVRDTPHGWAAVRLEAMGIVGADEDPDGRIRVGGAFGVARDALSSLEAAIGVGAEAQDPERVGALVDEHLGAPSAALFGVRALTTIRDVIVDAASRRAAGS